jgi:RNA polymerase sigma-70 factor (ECF subfamily)
MSTYSDDELVEQVGRDSDEALLALYDRYAGRVYALTLHIVGDSMWAEEVTQDVFLKLKARARRYRAARGSFAAWLLTIARNTALDRLRLERRRPVLSGESDPEETWHELSDQESRSDEARWRSLHFALQSLPSEQRQVVELSYYQGLSHSEIAEHLNCPIGTVKTRLRLGVEHLRRQWLADEPAGNRSVRFAPDV